MRSLGLFSSIQSLALPVLSALVRWLAGSLTSELQPGREVFLNSTLPVTVHLLGYGRGRTPQEIHFGGLALGGHSQRSA